MARSMRDVTVAATASKIFAACGATGLDDSYYHWDAVVKAWSVGSTRPLHDEDRCAVIEALQALDAARRAELDAEEDD